MEQSVVDDKLGRFTRRATDLICRVVEGSVDIERAKFGVEIGIENPPTEKFERGSWGPYLVETHWAWDQPHREFFTISIEKCDSVYGLEKMLDLEPKDQDKLLDIIWEVYKKHVPSHGSRKIVRVYQIMRTDWFGYKNVGVDGEINRPDPMLNFQLKPLFDFADGDERLTPCKCTIIEDK